MSTILVLTNSSGGLYDFRNELLVRLLEHHRVVISLPDTTKVKELEEEGCEIITTPINRRGVNPKEDIKLFLEYRRLLKTIKPDLVITECQTQKDMKRLAGARSICLDAYGTDTAKKKV